MDREPSFAEWLSPSSGFSGDWLLPLLRRAFDLLLIGSQVRHHHNESLSILPLRSSSPLSDRRIHRRCSYHAPERLLESHRMKLNVNIFLFWHREYL